MELLQKPEPLSRKRTEDPKFNYSLGQQRELLQATHTGTVMPNYLVIPLSIFQRTITMI